MAEIARPIRPPEPTLRDPYAQVRWIFHRVEREYGEPTAANFRYAKNKYLHYLEETHAYYPALESDGRFYLHLYWETDALIRFVKWLDGRWTSKTRYGIYKCVRRVMDFAYALRITDIAVYHPPVSKGVRETNSNSAYSEETQEVINAAIAKWMGLGISVVKGYQPTGLGIPYRKKNTIQTIVLDSAPMDIQEAAKRFGLPRGTISGRLLMGWSAAEAVGLVQRPLGGDGVPKGLVVEGREYPSVSSAAQAYGVSGCTASLRLRKGYSPEQALGVVPTVVHQSDERALLWSFENDYGCDARAMLDDFNKRKLSVVCTEKRMRTLFSRWGVWPYVDDRVVMPLATELGMLTALNVESIKELETDSYQAAHGLTGKPTLIHRKERSSSATRPAEKPLHLGLLDMGEFIIQPEVAERVKNLIHLVLQLTSKIRANAPPELARRLFIFEDVEQSRRNGAPTIVAIDPKGKTSTWYDRFKREEGLEANFGDNFSFNISRCRPTLVTNMVLAGASLHQVQTILGHANIETTASYLDDHRLQPVFNKTMSEALDKIKNRSIKHRKSSATARETKQNTVPRELEAAETLSGCACTNPYAPSEDVRAATKHKEGTVCRFWNMCIFCDRAIVTESSLPKIIVYKGRVSDALRRDSPAIRPRRELLEDVVKLIDGILKDDAIFPKAVLEEARRKAVALDDVLVDQLIYHGI